MKKYLKRVLMLLFMYQLFLWLSDQRPRKVYLVNFLWKSSREKYPIALPEKDEKVASVAIVDVEASSQIVEPIVAADCSTNVSRREDWRWPEDANVVISREPSSTKRFRKKNWLWLCLLLAALAWLLLWTPLSLGLSRPVINKPAVTSGVFGNVFYRFHRLPVNYCSSQLALANSMHLQFSELQRVSMSMTDNLCVYKILTTRSFRMAKSLLNGQRVNALVERGRTDGGKRYGELVAGDRQWPITRRDPQDEVYVFVEIAPAWVSAQDLRVEAANLGAVFPDWEIVAKEGTIK